jgi:transcriptional regulator with XRE-family HTH domain
MVRQPHLASDAQDDGLDQINLHVCRRLRAKRILATMSQERLAKSLGISYQQLQRYEAGTSRLPCTLAYRAARALDVPVGYFFEHLMADGTAPVEPGLDQSILAAVRDIQAIGDPEVRRSLMRLVSELARTASAKG